MTRKLDTKGKESASARGASVIPQGKNEVFLIGTISSVPITKTLPSGDEVVEFRLVIDREKRREPRPQAATQNSETRKARREVDSLEIAVWKARVRKSALRLTPGDWVEISGSVHRRFWTSAGGLASRWQIEANLLRKL